MPIIKPGGEAASGLRTTRECREMLRFGGATCDGRSSGIDCRSTSSMGSQGSTPPSPSLASASGARVMGDEHNSSFYLPPDPDDDSSFGADESDASPQIIPPRGGDTRIPNRVIDDEAFKAFDPYAVRILLLLARMHRHPGRGRDGREWPGNNGRIVLSRIEAAEKCRINRRTATKALEALKSAELIEEMSRRNSTVGSGWRRNGGSPTCRAS